MPAFAPATYAPSAHPRGYARDRRLLQFTLAAAYPFFFASTVARRINPFARVPQANGSLVAETRKRAAAVVPFIFMG